MIDIWTVGRLCKGEIGPIQDHLIERWRFASPPGTKEAALCWKLVRKVGPGIDRVVKGTPEEEAGPPLRREKGKRREEKKVTRSRQRRLDYRAAMRERKAKLAQKGAAHTAVVPAWVKSNLTFEPVKRKGRKREAEICNDCHRIVSLNKKGSKYCACGRS